jgi:hypothetical protein
LGFVMGDLVIEDGDTLFDTNITVNTIRDLLNRPRGLNSGTIIEYVNLRNTQFNKVSRKVNYVGVDSTNAPHNCRSRNCCKTTGVC